MAETPANANPPKKARNPIERILVWGGILALVTVAVIEFRAKQTYDASVTGLEELSNGIRDVTVDEARQKMVGLSSSEGPTKVDGLETYNYSWFSLFKGGMYKVTLIANPDGKTLKTFNGPAFAEDPDEVAAKIKAANQHIPNGPLPSM